MNIKVTTGIYVAVKNDEQAEAASRLINRHLAEQMGEFPEGKILGVSVHRTELVTDEELLEEGHLE